MGINPTKPGFETFNIKIRPGNLHNLSVETPSSKGIIKAKLSVQDTKQVVTVEIPMNSKGTIILPENSQLIEVEDRHGSDLGGCRRIRTKWFWDPVNIKFHTALTNHLLQHILNRPQGQ